MVFMNSPILVALAPGVSVVGIIVSPTSSKKAIFSGVKPASFLAAVLQPVKKTSPPITTPPVSNAIIFKSSLRSIKLFL